MAPNVNLQRRKRQRDAERDIAKLRKELLKQKQRQKKQQEKEQKKEKDMERKKQQNKERSALLVKERCRRYYENKKHMKMSTEAAATNLKLNGGASTSTGSFTMSMVCFPNYSCDVYPFFPRTMGRHGYTNREARG
ncbi:hypothetical protein AVEN_33486-1 [Araneus ventricosus]|uniref:Uncharacterized protein n=1 Tax=Araneus ventricosus TaxID=182803 RepID=A0A4Y2GWZ7_ARAVE|nr:hypothetical protein AVEN_33486-1 [Araneus ventricosus]